MKNHKCIICNQIFDQEEVFEFDGHHFCSSCLEEQTVLCRDCGRRIYRGQNEGSPEHPLCDACYDDEYTHCQRCGRLLRTGNAHYFDDDDGGYCEDCYAIECNEDRPIHEYGYKPDPIFYGDGNRFFGVELEIDNGGEEDTSAEEILSIGNREDEHIYCKHDGSLAEGFEIVTHPMSLHYHLHTVPWMEICSKALQMGYTSHQAGSCGLHVHVNRDAFGETEKDQDTAIARVLYFVEKHWNELLIFSRRTQSQLDSWARRYGYKDQPKEMLEHAKNGYAGRYTCVNLTNYATIEFRIFRGTLKLNTIFATLQMVNHICNVALSLSDEALKNLSWSAFAERITEPELIRYLKERRIYINDRIETEEEI